MHAYRLRKNERRRRVDKGAGTHTVAPRLHLAHGGQQEREHKPVTPVRRRIAWHRLVIFAVSVYFAVTFVAQETQLGQLRAEVHRLQSEIGVQQAELAELRARRDYLQSSEYVEAEARRRFNLTRPGEIHFLTIWEEAAGGKEGGRETLD